ncbi:hypothetical protein [Streptomyces halstedii]|uniref:Uncharacterized protein n=1 Tax=Streptomyces halstedii TaxID=1944 RepID=A0A6N9U082_STRHA|nr:hypothetical protein [Streptomyces halstedii]MBV7669233.1 hypothetical protein [Streptomyces halstedii]NEA17204.1 hypothetical protein [Streptomyces halstedii]
MDPPLKAANSPADRGARLGAEDLWFRKRVDTSHYASPSLFPPCTCGARICPDRTDDNTPPDATPRNEYR